MKRQIADCLSFAEGNGKVAINKAKGSDFPNTLINDPKINKMVALRESGKTLRDIATEMEFKSQKTVVDHLQSYEKRKQLYDNWVVFWGTIEPIKAIPIETILDGIFTEKQILSIQKRGVCTLEDYLSLSVKMSVRDMQIFLGDTKSDYKERRGRVFRNIEKLIRNINK